MGKVQIAEYSVDMSSRWKKEVTYKKEESLSISTIQVKVPENEDRLILTPEVRNLIEQENNKVNEQGKIKDKEKIYITLSEEDKQKIRILEAFLSKLAGKKIKIKLPVFVKEKENVPLEKRKETPATRQSWQLEYKLHESYKESETLSFSSFISVIFRPGTVIRVVKIKLWLLIKKWEYILGKMVRRGLSRNSI